MARELVIQADMWSTRCNYQHTPKLGQNCLEHMASNNDRSDVMASARDSDDTRSSGSSTSAAQSSVAPMHSGNAASTRPGDDGAAEANQYGLEDLDKLPLLEQVHRLFHAIQMKYPYKEVRRSLCCCSCYCMHSHMHLTDAGVEELAAGPEEAHARVHSRQAHAASDCKDDCVCASASSKQQRSASAVRCAYSRATSQ